MAARRPAPLKSHTLLMLGAIALLLAAVPLLRPVEQTLGLSALFQWRGFRATPDDILLVAINPAASTALGFPQHSASWPRTVYIDLLERLQHLGARLVVMDIAFREARDPAVDQALGDAIGRAGNVLLFKYLQRQQIEAGTTLVDVQVEQPPIPALAEQALAVGAFVLPKFPAQVTHAPLELPLSGGPEVTLPLLAYLALQDQATIEAIWHQQLRQSEPLPEALNKRAHLLRQALRNTTQQLDPAARHLLAPFQAAPLVAINFYGPAGSFRTLPIQQVLDGDSASLLPMLEGATVYVGYATDVQTEQRDAYRTVFSNRFGLDLSGVEISATVLANLLDHSVIDDLPLLTLYASALLALLTGALCFRLRARANISVQLAAAIAYPVAAYLSFTRLHAWWPLVTPILVLLMTDLVLLAQRYQRHKQQIKHISQALRHYLPEHAARELGSSIHALEKRHQLVHGVCLITDICGYTTLSEELAPQELHQLMNEYYELLVGIITKRGGFVGNIVGDSLLALWTGPTITREMCEAAVCGAADILGSIRDHPDFSRRLRTCVGLHGGQFSLGNLGARGHFEYSPVGDIINTAARVEHLNRNLETALLCTETLAPELLDYFAGRKTQLRYLGQFALRNKTTPTGLYTLSDNRELDQSFALALSLYENQSYRAAAQHFEQLAEQFGDGPSRYYSDQCRSALTATQEQSHATRQI